MVSTAMPIELKPGEDAGRLANNFMLVQSLQKALSLSETNIKTVPRMICLIDEQEAWKAFLLPSGDVIRNAADFRVFLEGPRPGGCQTPIHVVRRMVKDTEAEETFERLIRGRPGNPTGANQYTSGKCDKITHSSDAPATIPLSPDVPRPQRLRDPARAPETGTSVSYTLRRLESRPDLLEMVKAGDMSPNAAAVKAGFRDEAITIPKDPLKASRRLLKHFNGDALTTLVAELANHAGFDLTPRK
jgi:hypothetical protein